MTREVERQLSREMAFAFPVMRMVVFVQRLMRMEWLIEAAISTISEGESKYSMIHLLPSRVLRAGFLVRMLSGLGFLPGRGDLLLVEVWDDERTGPEGTAEEARKDGFLCVWVEGSTLRRCEVTLSPEEI